MVGDGDAERRALAARLAAVEAALPTLLVLLLLLLLVAVLEGTGLAALAAMSAPMTATLMQ